MRLVVSTDDRGGFNVSIEGHAPVPAIADANGLRFPSGDAVKARGSPAGWELEMLTPSPPDTPEGTYRLGKEMSLRRVPSSAGGAATQPAKKADLARKEAMLAAPPAAKLDKPFR